MVPLAADAEGVGDLGRLPMGVHVDYGCHCCLLHGLSELNPIARALQQTPATVGRGLTGAARARQTDGRQARYLTRVQPPAPPNVSHRSYSSGRLASLAAHRAGAANARQRPVIIWDDRAPVPELTCVGCSSPATAPTRPDQRPSGSAGSFLELCRQRRSRSLRTAFSWCSARHDLRSGAISRSSLLSVVPSRCPLPAKTIATRGHVGSTTSVNARPGPSRTSSSAGHRLPPGVMARTAASPQ